MAGSLARLSWLAQDHLADNVPPHPRPSFYLRPPSIRGVRAIRGHAVDAWVRRVSPLRSFRLSHIHIQSQTSGRPGGDAASSSGVSEWLAWLRLTIAAASRATWRARPRLFPVILISTRRPLSFSHRGRSPTRVACRPCSQTFRLTPTGHTIPFEVNEGGRVRLPPMRAACHGPISSATPGLGCTGTRQDAVSNPAGHTDQICLTQAVRTGSAPSLATPGS